MADAGLLMPPPRSTDAWAVGDTTSAPPEMRTAKLAALIEEDFLGGITDVDCNIARTLVAKVFVPNSANTLRKLATVHKNDLRASLERTDLDSTQWLTTLREIVFGPTGDFPNDLRSSSSALSDASSAIPSGGSGRSTPVSKSATELIGGLHAWDAFEFPPTMLDTLRDAVQGSPDLTRMNNLLFMFNLAVFESRHLDMAQKTRYAKIICKLNPLLVECDMAEAIRTAFSNRRQGRWAGSLAFNPKDVNDYIIELSDSDVNLKGKFLTDSSAPLLLACHHESLKDRAMACLTAIRPAANGATPHTRRPRMLHTLACCTKSSLSL